MRLITPLALILLISLPIIWTIGRPRFAFRKRRDWVSLILRTVIMLLLIFALAGLQIEQAVDKLAVVFLVDVSDSMGGTTQAAQLDYIRQALDNKPPDDEAAIVLFGENAVPERSFSAVTEVADFGSTPVSINTDIARAIETGLSMFPPDATRRMVILSDGQATRGDAIARAQRAAVSGIEISYVSFFRDPVPDVRIIDLQAPARVAENQQFDVTMSIEAEAPTDATILLFAGGQLIQQEDVSLAEGVTNYSLTQTSGETGFLDFSARIDIPSQNDGFAQNNQLAAFSQIVGPSRVLLVNSEPSEIEHLLPALEQASILVDVIAPGNLPLSMSGLADYKSIIISNVPATDLSNAHMELLDQYVRDLGGGLVFVGGPDSYAPGGYFQTPLEETLPVEMQIKDQQRLPQLTIAYLMDRSGSMSSVGSSGVPNIELGKRAINLSVQLLQPTDRVGIASFDNNGSWIAPFQDVLDKRALIQIVNTLRAGGGTDILAGMRLVSQAIVSEPSDRKHIILMTDGGANPRGLIDLSANLFNEFNVTTSVISIGQTDPQFLREMTIVGNGNYHQVDIIEEIPTIFTLETVLATRSYIMEDPFVPTLTANNPIMDGIRSAPELQGYVATTPKSVAQVVLSGPEPFRDPILAVWQYGLGRVVAFTSDATSRWATDWVQWDGFSRFWGQTVSWTMNEGATSNLETRIVMVDEQARVIVDARDENGAFINGLSLETSLLNPDGTSRRVPLQQVAPGRYEAHFAPREEGAYFLTINGAGQVNGQQQTFNEVNGWVMSYSAEYIPRENDDALLARLAEITDGRSLADVPEDVFAHNLDARVATAPIWNWLVLLAILLLPIDIAVRRLILTRSDFDRFRVALFGGRTEQETRSERLNTLLNARQRARDITQHGETTTSAARLRGLGSRRTTEEIPDDPKPDDSLKPRFNRPTAPSAPPPSSGAAAPNDDNIGSRLLDRKRRRRDED